MGTTFCTHKRSETYFLSDTNTKIWAEITDLVILGRNYWSSCRVHWTIFTLFLFNFWKNLTKYRAKDLFCLGSVIITFLYFIMESGQWEMLALKAYVADGKNKVNILNKLPPVRIELGTSFIPVWCSPLWANLASACWGVYSLPFVSVATIDFWP